MWLIRFFVGLLLLPCCVAVTKTFALLLVGAGRASSSGLQGVYPLLVVGAGILLWIALLAIMPAPVRSYVLAHELTHALMGALMGARIYGVRVSRTGGDVKMSEGNFLIALAPYFVPLYTVLALALFYGVGLFVDFGGYRWLWILLIGMSLGFHFTFTVQALSCRQTDVSLYGTVFSYTLIYFCNILALLLVLVMFSSVTLKQLVLRLSADMTGTWIDCGIAGRLVWQKLQILMQ